MPRLDTNDASNYGQILSVHQTGHKHGAKYVDGDAQARPAGARVN